MLILIYMKHLFKRQFGKGEIEDLYTLKDIMLKQVNTPNITEKEREKWIELLNEQSRNINNYYLKENNLKNITYLKQLKDELLNEINSSIKAGESSQTQRLLDESNKLSKNIHLYIYLSKQQLETRDSNQKSIIQNKLNSILSIYQHGIHGFRIANFLKTPLGNVVEFLTSPELSPQEQGFKKKLFGAGIDENSRYFQGIKKLCEIQNQKHIYNAFIDACSNNVVDIVDYLLNKCKNTLLNINEGLLAACCSGNLETVELLLHSGADPNYKNEYGKTALFWTIAGDGWPVGDVYRANSPERYAEQLILLVKYGCKLNSRQIKLAKEEKNNNYEYLKDLIKKLKTEYKTRELAAKKIQRQLMKCMYNPDYKLCRNILKTYYDTYIAK